ncbi:hypothetical protein [Deinococcus aquatilis]|uniref:DinB/UmuC family translesion DNA polymerase n=1 Tax=Deinococcus aquatilis TaxID=519440 RepID=UPI00247FE797|nr:hypothetical protein [Deinococcus aquatilis]
MQGLGNMHNQLTGLCERTSRRLIKHGLAGRVVAIKVKFSNFELVSRQLSLPAPVQSAAELERVARHLLTVDFVGSRAVRLLGVSVSGLVNPEGRDVVVPLFTVV